LAPRPVEVHGPYKAVLYHAYGPTILIFLAVLFVNLFGAALAIGRRFFLKNTGRKLSHLDKQFNVSHADCPSCERGGFQLMSRDAFPMIRKMPAKRATPPRAAPSVSRDQHLQARGTAGIQRRKRLAAAMAPRFGSSIRTARTE